MRAPSEDMMQILAEASEVALTIGRDLHGNIMPATPDQIVAVNDSGGYPPSTSTRILHPTVQVLVRGVKGDYRQAYALAQTIRDVLVPAGADGQPGPSAIEVGGSRYLGIYTQSDVGFVGYDESDRPVFSVNFRMDRTEATP